MAFKPGAGYGDMFSYTVGNIRTDGFEVQNMAGTIMRQAVGELVFARLFNPSRDAFGMGRGGTFTVPIFKHWGAPTSVTPLTSGTAIGLGAQTTDSVSMSINEYGTGVAYETLGDWITNLDIRGELTKTLGMHIGRMINWLDYDLVSNSKFSIECTSTGSYSALLGTNKQVSGATFGELGPGGLALLYDTFRKSLVPPVTDRGFYALVGNAQTFRHLKQGSVFINAQLYSNLQGIRMQVLGEFMNFVFIETEELTGRGTSFALGGNACGYGFGKLPTVTYYPDFGSDAGRLQVWKTLFYRGQGPIWRDKGTSIITVRSNSGAYNYNTIG
jgi:hypothetical protein